MVGSPLLLLESSKKVDKQVQQFENDLIYKNRFFLNMPALKKYVNTKTRPQSSFM